MPAMTANSLDKPTAMGRIIVASLAAIVVLGGICAGPPRTAAPAAAPAETSSCTLPRSRNRETSDGCRDAGILANSATGAHRGSPDPAEMPARQVFRTHRRPAVATVARSGERPQRGVRAVYTGEESGSSWRTIRLCQGFGPPLGMRGKAAVGAGSASGCDECEAARLAAWQAFAQGEYVAHARSAHVPEYRLRVDDQLDLIYRRTREVTPQPYRLNVGDEIRIESFTDPALTRDLTIQPDGTITLRLLGQVSAAGHTVTQLRDALDHLYLKYYKNPTITVTPLKVNTKLEDLVATVDRRQGFGGQQQLVRVTPEGTISLPAIGSICAQGLTLRELQQELNERYREAVDGIEVIPVLATRAPRFVYVLGEVRVPARYELVGPTTVMQAISMAGGWNYGANLRQIVILRRGDDWGLMGTMVNLQAALLGNNLCPAGEIWLNDSDIVLVPKGPIMLADEFINLVFTRGIYSVFPLQTTINFSKLSTI